MKLVIALTLALCAASAQDCAFSNDACPVDLDNAIELFYFDGDDVTSCQHKCTLMNDCSYFTMLQDDDLNLTKCFLFKTCDAPEECSDCVSGPESPDYEPCMIEKKRALSPPANKSLNPRGGQTCETSVENVIAIYYFDSIENHSCKAECDAINECGYWTSFPADGEHSKCFLFSSCDSMEDCSASIECETNPSE